MEVHKHTRYQSTYHENCVTTFQIGVKIVILEYKSEKRIQSFDGDHIQNLLAMLNVKTSQCL